MHVLPASNCYRNFSWSGNDIVLVCKLRVSDQWIIHFTSNMSGILANIYISVFLLESESVLLLAFVKKTLSQLCTYFTWKCNFSYFLQTVESLVFNKKCSNVFLHLSVFFVEQNSRTGFRKLVITWKWLIIESCLPLVESHFYCSFD